MGFDIVLLSFTFFIIALCYASAGFGGGSSYLAILWLTGVSMTTLRPTALLCNIIVVLGGTFLFQKANFISFIRALPLILVSIPMAFIGGYWPISNALFLLILGGSLLISAILLWMQPAISKPNRLFDKSITNMIVGGAIGLLAGLVGIGGGIFLAPVLHLARWGDAKHIAAMTSLFILVNSISGLVGQFLQYSFEIDILFVLPLLGAVLIGGQIGSRLSINWFNHQVIKRITAVLIFIVSIRVLWQQLFF